jgi:predicted nucleic acid-binding protein
MVLDASVAVAAARPNEPSHAASRARVSRVLGGGDEVILPALFPIEVGAALARVGEPPAAVRAYVEALVSSAFQIIAIGPRNARKVRDVAIAAKLRAADAMYVWLASLVRPADVVILHDPQTAGLAPFLKRAGARVIWRCHIGATHRTSRPSSAGAFWPRTWTR